MHWEWSIKLLWFIVLALGSWITLDSCNALGVVIHIGIGDRTMDMKTVSYTYCYDDTWFLSKVVGSLQQLTETLVRPVHNWSIVFPVVIYCSLIVTFGIMNVY